MMFLSIYRIKGIHCGSCISRIEKKAISLGAYKASFDIKEMILKVYYEEVIDNQLFVEEVKSMNYQIDFLASYDEDEIT